MHKLESGKTMFDPTESELIYVHNMTVAFEKVVTRDPQAAKKMFKETLVPYIGSQLRTIKILDGELLGSEEQSAILLACNAEMITILKKNNIPLPNFDEIEREVRERLQKKRNLVPEKPGA